MIRETIQEWHRKNGQFMSPVFKLMMTRHIWGKAPNTPMHVTAPPIGFRAMVVMNELMTMPEYHELQMVTAAAWRQRLQSMKIDGEEATSISATNRELTKACELVIHTVNHGLLLPEQISPHEKKQLCLD